MSSHLNYLGAKKCCATNLAKTVMGPQGAQGAGGPIGPFGNQGTTGPAGGPQGATGSQGATGFQGATGSQGAIGTGGVLGYWGSFWSTQTQTNANPAKAMTLNNTDPNSYGISIVSGSQITFTNEGVYNIQFSAQIQDTTSGGSANIVQIWFVKNGISIPDSNTKLSTDNQNSFVVASWNFMLKLNAGDHIEIYWYSADTGMQLTNNTSVAGPNVPSVIITAQQVMYTQVGVTGSQGATGTQGATGSQGSTGTQGATGSQGATGLQGATGSQGAIGPSQWTSMNGIGLTGTGYTGIGVTGQDVLIYGNLLVTGAIDPTSINFTPELTGPINSIWTDTDNDIRINESKINNIKSTGSISSVLDYNILSNTKSITFNANGISLKRDILTSVKETILTPLDITDVNTGNSISFADLTYLPIGLGALTVPSNGTTCNFNDAIQLQNYDSTLAPPPTHSEVKIGSNPSTLYGMNINTTTATPFTVTSNTGYDLNITNSINMTSGADINLNATNGQVVNNVTGFTVNASDYIQMTANNDFITMTADDDITLNSNSLGNIALNAPNINSYNYAMPICFDILTIDRNSGNTTGGQNWDKIWTEKANLPPQFFVDTPISGYTSSNWRIDFTIQTWNAGGQNNQSDKALAYYIDFEDQNSNIYTPVIFNKTYPFCRHNNNSTWSGGGSNTEFQPFTWTDYVDFSGLATSGSGNLPLNIRLFFTSDNSKNFQFSMKVGLTRTNILPP